MQYTIALLLSSDISFNRTFKHIMLKCLSHFENVFQNNTEILTKSPQICLHKLFNYTKGKLVTI